MRDHPVRGLHCRGLMAAPEEPERLGRGDLEPLLLLLDRLELQPLAGGQNPKQVEPDLLVGEISGGAKLRHRGRVLAPGEKAAGHQLAGHRAQHLVGDGLLLAEGIGGRSQLVTHPDVQPNEDRQAGEDQEHRHRRGQHNPPAQRPTARRSWASS